MIKGQRGLIETNDRRRIERHKDEGVIRRKLEKEIGKDDSPRNNDDSLKDKLYERQNNEMVRRMLDTKEIERDSEKVVNNGRKNNYGNSDSVVKVKMEVKDKKCNSFKEEIDERLKTIDRAKNNSLIELAKKIEILSLPIETDRKRDITVLNTIELSNSEKTERYVNNTIVINAKDMDILKNNVTDLIELLNKLVK